MRILIVTTFAPFSREANDEAADALAAALAAHRPEVVADRVRLPRGEHLALAARLTDLTACDRLVAVGDGSTELRHSELRVWDPGDAPAAAPAAPSWRPVVEALLG